MEIEVSVRFPDFFSSSVKEGKKGVCGRKNYKRREDFVHQAGQSATPKQCSVLAQGSISSENFSCSISIAKFE